MNFLVKKLFKGIIFSILFSLLFLKIFIINEAENKYQQEESRYVNNPVSAELFLKIGTIMMQ